LKVSTVLCFVSGWMHLEHWQFSLVVCTWSVRVPCSSPSSASWDLPQEERPTVYWSQSKSDFNSIFVYFGWLTKSKRANHHAPACLWWPRIPLTAPCQPSAGQLIWRRCWQNNDASDLLVPGGKIWCAQREGASLLWVKKLHSEDWWSITVPWKGYMVSYRGKLNSGPIACMTYRLAVVGRIRSCDVGSGWLY